MKHRRAINRKATRIEGIVMSRRQDVVALQDPAATKPHIPTGCSLSFFPRWEVDSSGGTAGFC
jgi:hypothetical protein